MAFVTIMQFILQTGGIVLLAIMMTPITQIIAYDDSMWEGATVENQARRDSLYQFGLIIPVVAMGGNIIWLYQSLQRKQQTYDDI